METKANYVVIGVFTLAVIVGVFGFVYWFQNIGGTGERAFYRVVFDGSVSGCASAAQCCSTASASARSPTSSSIPTARSR
jgi:hypothetical protein